MHFFPISTISEFSNKYQFLHWIWRGTRWWYQDICRSRCTIYVNIKLNSSKKWSYRGAQKSFDAIGYAQKLLYVLLNAHAHLSSDGMLWARVDHKELVSKKSGFVNCSEKKPSAHCSASTLQLVRCVFANLLIDEWVKELECYASSTLLLLFYSLSVFVGEQKQTDKASRPDAWYHSTV